MGDRTNRPYSDLVALLLGAVLVLIMISITEAAASHERLMGNPESPLTDHIRALDEEWSKQSRGWVCSPRWSLGPERFQNRGAEHA